MSGYLIKDACIEPSRVMKDSQPMAKYIMLQVMHVHDSMNDKSHDLSGQCVLEQVAASHENKAVATSVYPQ